MVAAILTQLSGMTMRYWLMKSEPHEFSIDDLAKSPKKSTAWFGVRNYQARNFKIGRAHV